MRLTKLLLDVPVEEIIYGGDSYERDIYAVCTDSRKIAENGLFVCLSGGNVDGHLFAREAVNNGAVAVVCERTLDVSVPQVVVKDTRETLALIASAFYGYPAERLKIIGVTGTNGKTTTANTLAFILNACGKKTGVIGTLGVFYADKFIPSELTTPDPLFLHKAFAKMLADDIEYGVMEVSAHALYYKKTAGIPFAFGIFTNLSQDHLDFFGNMDAYKQAKMRLFALKNCKTAIVNGDDEVGREIGALREKSGEKTIYYGLDSPADAFAIITHEDLYGSESVFNVNDKLSRVSLRLLGKHNVYNALSAVTCATELGIRIEECAWVLKSFTGVNGRLQRVATYKKADVFVDFAHTPDGLEKSLTAMQSHCKKRLICLFGCGGNRDKSKRPIMGETVAKLCDFAVLTSDNPRFEDPLDILSDIERGYRRFSKNYVVVSDRRTAIGYALDCLKEGDALLVAGKGGEVYQEIMGIKYPFNDNDIIEKMIKEREKLPDF